MTIRGVIGSACVLAGLLSVSTNLSALENRWYLGGAIEGLQVEDASNNIRQESVPTTGAVEIPGIIILLPTGGAPATFEDFDSVYDTGAAFALRFGYDFTGPFRMDLEARYSKSDIDEFHFDNGEPIVKGDSKTAFLMSNIWYDFNWKENFSPYIGFGLGGGETKLGSVEDTVFVAQFGAGISWLVDEHNRFEMGYRLVSADDPEYEIPENRFTSQYQSNGLVLGWRHNFFEDDGGRDTDGDGVRDGLDRCPNTPRGALVDEHGCALDGDKDGVADGIDQCPNTPPGVQVNAVGCDRSKDSDGDGIFNSADQCPNTPKGLPVMKNGCGESQSVLLQGVIFDFDTARLNVGAEKILVRVAQLLNASPGFVVELQGHTDSLGNAEYNQQLSYRRANAVRAFLMKEGVDPARLKAKGYGQSRPIASNDNPEGRATNRRVEMHVLEGTGGF